MAVAEKAFYTTEEVARMLDMSKATVMRKVQAGEIPAKKFGRLWRFPRQRVDAWLEQGLPPVEPAEAGPAPAARIERRAFLALPLEERRRILAAQAAQAAATYDPSEGEEWQGGDVVEY